MGVGEWEFISKDGLPLYKSIIVLPLPDFALEKIYLTRQETYVLIKHTNFGHSEIRPEFIKMTFFNQ